MNKKKTDLPEEENQPKEDQSATTETIKLTVSEVDPEEKEPSSSDSVSAIDNLYADRMPDGETPKSESPMVDTQVDDQPKDQAVDKVEMDNLPIITTKQERRSAKSGFWLFVGGLLMGGLVIGGIFGFVVNPKAKTQLGVNSAPPTPLENTEQPAPEPTMAEVEVDYSLYQVKVLNGSGVTGAAASVKDLLGGIGFDQIETGNASVSDQKDTLVQLKSSVPEAVMEKVKDSLSEYNVTLGEPLADSADFDVQVIVGTKNEE